MAEEEKKKQKIIIEGVDTSELNWGTLLRFIRDLLDKVMIEKGERTRAQLETDLIRTAWHNAEKELEVAKARHRVLLNTCDNVMKEYDESITAIQHEMKYLEYSKPIEMNLLDEELKEELNDLREDWDENILMAMWEEKTEMKVKIDNTRDELFTLYDIEKKRLQEDLNNYKNELDEMMYKIVKENKERFNKNCKELNKLHMMEILRVQEDRNLLMRNLESEHTIVFGKTKYFFKETTEHDVSLILKLFEEKSTIKMRMKDLEDKIIIMNRQIHLNKVNHQQALKSVTWARNKVKQFEQDKNNLEYLQKTIKKRDVLREKGKKRKEELEKELSNLIEERDKILENMQDLCKKQKGMLEELKGLKFAEVFRKDLQQSKEYVEKLELHVENDENFRSRLKTMTNIMKEERKNFEKLPFLIIREMKAQCDFLATLEAKMKEFGLETVPKMSRITKEIFKYLEGSEELFAS